MHHVVRQRVDAVGDADGLEPLTRPMVGRLEFLLRVCLPVAAALLVQGCLSRPAAERAVDALAAATMARQGLPGLAVVVMRGDDVLVARGYGVESLARGDPVTAHTSFMHNSVGKHFTAAMVMALAGDGALTLDDPVIRHLPDFARLPQALTVRHLLNQTSGVREAAAVPALWQLLERPDATWAEMRHALRRHATVDWPPGSRWSYSNTNYLLLEALITEIAGRPLATLYAERFFRPHRLSSLHVCPPRAPDVQGTAIGYSARRDRLEPAGPVNNVVSLGAGGLCGNALDLARWASLLATGRVIGAEAWREMTAPARLADGSLAEYGLGLALMPLDGVPRAGHSGIGFGYSSVVAHYPRHRLTIAVLANRFGFPDALERRIARRLLRLPEPDYRDAGIAAAHRTRWAGRYDVGMAGWSPTFLERDGRLWFRLFGPSTTYALIRTPDGALVPETEPDAMLFRFRETDAGVVVKFYTGGTQPWAGTRLGPADD